MESKEKAGEREDTLGADRAQVVLVTPKVGASQSPLARPYDIKISSTTG